MGKTKLWLTLFTLLVLAGMNCNQLPTKTASTSTGISSTGTPHLPLIDSSIAFLDHPAGHTNIFLIQPDGSRRIRLTDHQGIDSQITWSPDGRRIAFVSERSGNTDIYVVDIENARETRLTEYDASDFHPAWSPDGQEIAFVSARTGSLKIHLMNADGTNVRRLVSGMTDRSETFPSWSPDGGQIAFSVGDPTGTKVICVVNRDGSDERILTSQLDRADYPQWAPDGRYIAFTVAMRIEESGIALENRVGLVQPNGQGLHVLKVGTLSDWYPVWSPDGHKLALAAYSTEGEGVLVVLDVDSQQKKVLTSPVRSWGLTWAPGGDRIAYMPANKQGIWIIGVDGSGNYKLTDWGEAPVWSPFRKQTRPE